jgi:hypothetical protein
LYPKAPQSKPGFFNKENIGVLMEELAKFKVG